MYRWLGLIGLLCAAYASMAGTAETLTLNALKVCRAPRSPQTTKAAFYPSVVPSRSKFARTNPVDVIADSDEPLKDLSVCSVQTAPRFAPAYVCAARELADKSHEIKITLKAQTSAVQIAGYMVTTDNYNGDYLTPVVEAKPGDTVAAHIENNLKPRPHDMPHGDDDQNPTNLHYFHGGIVSPANARPKDAELGTGDNVYVHIKAGSVFDLNVHIPGAGELDGRTLEAKAVDIAHPTGLDWYHSHEHHISSDQVNGGMSGLLSVGEALDNVKAKCSADPSLKKQCDDDTLALKQSTEVHYLLLRDLPLKNISARPDQAQNAKAEWDPTARDFTGNDKCGIVQSDGTLDETPEHRLGFCQVERQGANSAWLFTVNGQRYPTVTVGSSRNALFRIGNVGSNLPYWLELKSEDGAQTMPLTLLSRDGVVPANPVDPTDPNKPIDAKNVDDLLLMPAARAEVYIRNDQTVHDAPQTWILRTKGLKTGFKATTDSWPPVQLAKIVLAPNHTRSAIGVALNAPVGTTRKERFTRLSVAPTPSSQPVGCVRDIDPSNFEYRRVTFKDLDSSGTGAVHPRWSVLTELIRPIPGGLKDEKTFKPEKPTETTVGLDPHSGAANGFPFEFYLDANEHVDWTKPSHVCIKLDHVGSHQQLWVLANSTGTVHNFHIHQMKFRLATTDELKSHFILPPSPSTFTAGPGQFQYKLYDDVSRLVQGRVENPDWHDTIPIPPATRVFVVMSFDATQQIGRFVFHCHILKHEDDGLMAPIEVWDPSASL
jgi:FtsP/CotA-like multicopper oxidase with cupredoxin domain